jgi:hypothetical protein
MGVGRLGCGAVDRLPIYGFRLVVISSRLILLRVGLVTFVPFAPPLVLALSLRPPLGAGMHAAALVAI